jgi:hypothetical protein
MASGVELSIVELLVLENQTISIEPTAAAEEA